MQQLVIGLRNSLVWRTTALMVILVGLSITVMAGLGYWKLYQVTEQNASIRIDRAARAASAIISQAVHQQFVIIQSEGGRPLSIVVDADKSQSILEYRPEYDELLKEIGVTNQGAANLFKYNVQTNAFDRFVTTFRKPDGTLPPPMSLQEGHPAFASLVSKSTFVGEVPVNGRLRLAYLTPIVTSTGNIAGALAVDVGWVDDLVIARNNLQSILFGSAAFLLLIVGSVGVLVMQSEMKPLRKMAEFANALGSGGGSSKLPFLQRSDEVGALAHGLSRVVSLQDELEHLAYTDLLTEVGNRTRYLADIEKAMIAVNSAGKKAAIIHLDIKRFGQINDAHGQAVGDQVLVHVADVLKEKFKEEAQVYRITADQFCVISTEESSANFVDSSCEKILEILQAPLVLSECELALDCRVGIVMIPADANDAETAHRNAGLALFHAKQSKSKKLMYFTQEMNDGAQRELQIETMLREALAKDQLSLHYQPQICTPTHKLFGLEALLRWNHPSEGNITPNEFIPIAEKTGLIVELGNWVLDESCRQTKKWLNEGLEFQHVAVNVSPIQLGQQNFVQIVEECIERHGLDGKYLCLELTESVFIEDGESRITNIMNQLRKHNISFSLDDFGSGYSSLGYLNRLPFDQLKIDRYFVSGAHQDANKAKLLTGMVGLGKGLGLSVVAEGAEETGEIELLKDISCDIIQGYYFSKPVPASRLPNALKEIADTKPLLVETPFARSA